ncbi:hypothetical protein [Pseudomonas sp. EpS/L25]|uniref:hypothetical protein n=1 Tax=Pseudomonas sp. EpS/L25 TaxID=1749078 RepID=UPI000743E385|nr:hypothetical protein [Pseudomonas sp. EpS/L25]KUM43271.1 hypothetical protein AR540_05860 [Pseudomonas sp. EpS/L25]
MDKLHERLAQLDPPLRHRLERQADGLLIILIDPEHNARVSRFMRSDELRVERINLVLLHAINELRRKGAHVPLDKDSVFINDLSDECISFPG